jgi:hypothetical protein
VKCGVSQKCFPIVVFGLGFLYGYSCIEAVFPGKAGIVAGAK